MKNRDDVVFHQDNARPHTARITLETIARLQWEVLPHPLYSIDLAPNEYHLYLTLDNHIRCRRFENREVLEYEVIHFSNSEKQDFYKNGIYDLVSKWCCGWLFFRINLDLTHFLCYYCLTFKTSRTFWLSGILDQKKLRYLNVRKKKLFSE